MLVRIKLSPRKYMLINVPTISTWHGFPSDIKQPPDTGYELHSISEPLTVGTYAEVTAHAQRFAIYNRQTISHDDWKRKLETHRGGV